MPSVLIVYGSSHGHTAVIADRIAKELRAAGCEALVKDVRALPRGFQISRFDAVVLGGRVHGAKFPRKLRRFARDHRDQLNRRPSAFYTVSLSMAGKDAAAKQEIHRITAAFPAEAGWKPTATAAFAGALLYSRYGFILRYLMRRISAAAGGDTDTSKDYVYTDWDEVCRFALELLARVGAARPATPAAPL